MKIAHIVSHGGLNGVATTTATLIKEQVSAGHQVTLVHRPGAWIASQLAGAPVNMVPCRFSRHPAEMSAVGRQLDDAEIDVVHSHGSSANVYAMIFRCAVAAPTVMTAHSRQFQPTWRFAHQVIGLSDHTARYYTSRFLIAKSRIHSIPNMFDAQALPIATDAERLAARQKLGIAPETFLLGSVGVIGQRKRQSDMVQILDRLLQAGCDAELALIGPYSRSGPGTQTFERALADPAMRGRIHLLGERQDAADLVAGLEVYLCTSEQEEAPIAPLEAMARGVPVISTDVGNMADLLPESLIFKVADIAGMAAMALRFRGDPGLMRHQGLAGRAVVESLLAPSAILPRIEAVYDLALLEAGQKHRRIVAPRRQRNHPT
ncbi:glycosyltransferase [Mesorhizobium sp. NBSH29]|uniref:glycosyltransferase family 4 protein n=1 Tax=Mesorhizobium sp. NBSH29 TaxID=2654249 RepID=UPI0018964477|nr:glycosyltransferase family 4 protein [Mesorhizobium sp. NBSH29]QPC88406.1 glycosyltransferase [Mesorhizobium sp. NBSH29]